MSDKAGMTDAELRDALDRPDELAQLPALIMANIEDVPNWRDSTPLVTAHAHAWVLHHDLPDALGPVAHLAPEAEPSGANSAIRYLRSMHASVALLTTDLTAAQEASREALAITEEAWSWLDHPLTDAEPSAAWDRQRACEAARTASMDFGQWVPQRWLDLFFAAYEARK